MAPSPLRVPMGESFNLSWLYMPRLSSVHLDLLTSKQTLVQFCDFFEGCFLIKKIKMSKLSKGIRNVIGEAPKPAWIHWPGQRAFCCCFTIRTGASIIGWFNFVSFCQLS